MRESGCHLASGIFAHPDIQSSAPERTLRSPNSDFPAQNIRAFSSDSRLQTPDFYLLRAVEWLNPQKN
jgi:hypothetical protein